jgi:hypothetical protein
MAATVVVASDDLATAKADGAVAKAILTKAM